MIICAEIMSELKSACDIAMHNVLAARIPECGDFGKIAQSLAWAIDQLENVDGMSETKLER